MSASRPVAASDAGVPAPGDEHCLPAEADGTLRTEDDDFGQPYTVWEKFLARTDVSTWPATSPARPI